MRSPRPGRVPRWPRQRPLPALHPTRTRRHRQRSPVDHSRWRGPQRTRWAMMPKRGAARSRWNLSLGVFRQGRGTSPAGRSRLPAQDGPPQPSVGLSHGRQEKVSDPRDSHPTLEHRQLRSLHPKQGAHRDLPPAPTPWDQSQSRDHTRLRLQRPQSSCFEQDQSQPLDRLRDPLRGNALPVPLCPR